jgi:glyoxylase-like metal-dependent hydrolase (beta-lactamase superfamily II)
MSITHSAVSEDSGELWSEPGAWAVADGVWRVPLPLPLDGLRAVNVYVIETGDGLTLIDGGWAIEISRQDLERALRALGRSIADIRAFLVTHVHRDHYTQAVALRRETGARISLGAQDKPTLDRLRGGKVADRDPRLTSLHEADASDLADQWERLRKASRTDPSLWEYPDDWLSSDREMAVGARTLTAIHTPGHTQGHYVFRDAAAGLLFAGDHVLPTITPSIGFEGQASLLPLEDFMSSLIKVRALPDSRLLPAHGPVVSSVHRRVDELLAHHEDRLDQCVGLVDAMGKSVSAVAERLGWTRHARSFSELDVPNRVLATLETQFHLDLLVARGRIERRQAGSISLYYLPAPA